MCRRVIRTDSLRRPHRRTLERRRARGAHPLRRVSWRSMNSARARAFAVVVATYLAALAGAIAASALVGHDTPILTVFVADCVATLLVFAASMAFDNSSLYDPYWS